MEEASNKFLVPSAIVVAGLLIAGAIYMGGNTPRTTLGEVQTDKAIENIEVSKDDHIVGSRNAPIVVVEYSDTECPFCKVFHETMRTIVAEYKGEVAWVYRHFPIASLHSKAGKEAEATECAASLGGETAFWQYINTIFDVTNSNDSLDLNELPRIAGEIGLDVTAFNKCLESGEFKSKIDKAVKDAIASGARGTPYSVIISKSGKRAVINGAEPIANVRAKIDALIEN